MVNNEFYVNYCCAYTDYCLFYRYVFNPDCYDWCNDAIFKRYVYWTYCPILPCINNRPSNSRGWFGYYDSADANNFVFNFPTGKARGCDGASWTNYECRPSYRSTTFRGFN